MFYVYFYSVLLLLFSIVLFCPPNIDFYFAKERGTEKVYIITLDFPITNSSVFLLPWHLPPRKTLSLSSLCHNLYVSYLVFLSSIHVITFTNHPRFLILVPQPGQIQHPSFLDSSLPIPSPVSLTDHKSVLHTPLRQLPCSSIFSRLAPALKL